MQQYHTLKDFKFLLIMTKFQAILGESYCTVTARSGYKMVAACKYKWGLERKFLIFGSLIQILCLWKKVKSNLKQIFKQKKKI